MVKLQLYVWAKICDFLVDTTDFITVASCWKSRLEMRRKNNSSCNCYPIVMLYSWQMPEVKDTSFVKHRTAVKK